MPLEMLVGVALPSVATPPDIERTKSPTSKSPFPANPVPLAERLLNTDSEKVAVMVLLSAARAVEEMVGRTFSNKLTVLLL